MTYIARLKVLTVTAGCLSSLDSPTSYDALLWARLRIVFFREKYAYELAHFFQIVIVSFHLLTSFREKGLPPLLRML